MLEAKQNFIGLEKGRIYEQETDGKDIVFTDTDTRDRTRISADRLWRVSDLFAEFDETDGM